MNILTAVACIALCATAANAKDFSAQEKADYGWAECQKEVARADQSAQDAASFDRNGHPKKPTVDKFVALDHQVCKRWEDHRKAANTDQGN